MRGIFQTTQISNKASAFFTKNSVRLWAAFWFFQKSKNIFLNPSKSPFRRIEGLFKEANWWGHCYLQIHWFILPKTTLCRYSKRWFFLCTQYFLVHCPFWTAKEVEGFFICPIKIFKFRFSTRPANGQRSRRHWRETQRRWFPLGQNREEKFFRKSVCEKQHFYPYLLWRVFFQT